MLLQYIEYQFVIRALYESMAWSGKKEQFSCVPIATLQFSIFTFYSSLKRDPQPRQRDFSLFTLHFSLFTKEETATASAILHSSFYILHLINE